MASKESHKQKSKSTSTTSTTTTNVENNEIDWNKLGLREISEKYLERRSINGRIIFSMLSGSQSYNLHHSNSDNDYVSVFVGNPKDFLLLRTNLPTSTNTLLSEPQIPDMILWEIRTFFSLLLQGNPFAMSCLWINRNKNKFWESEKEWRELEKNRMMFVNKETIQGHLSYVKEQLKLHSKKQMIGKRFYHCPRLLLFVKKMISPKVKEEELCVWLDHSEERDWLLSIKNSEFPLENDVKKTYSILEDIESKKPWSHLPDNANAKILEKIMMECYEQDFLNDKTIPTQL